MSAQLLMINPRRRKKSKKSKSRSASRLRAVSNPAPKKRRRRGRRSFTVYARRNPISVPKNLVDGQIMPAAIGAAGALVNDIALGFLVSKLPASLQSGYLLYGVKAASAIGLGMLAENVLSKSMARQGAQGALTCIFHDIARAGFQRAVPSIQLGEQFFAPQLGEQFYAPQLGEQFNYPPALTSRSTMTQSLHGLNTSQSGFSNNGNRF